MAKRVGVQQQVLAINRWLVKFGGRRPSEAAMEVTTMSARRRRGVFTALRTAGCIAETATGWMAVKDSTAGEV